MNQLFSADLIIPVQGNPIKNGVIETDNEGVIQAIYPNNHGLPKSKIQRFDGALVPGFVNAHCHLELSHMLGKIPTGTGLFEFVKHIMAQRAEDDKTIKNAMKEADKQMYESGIVAVGDHINTKDSLEIKKKSKIYYHSFVELLGVKPELAESIYEKALNLEKQFTDKNLSCSLTPHAPYSVSKELFRILKKNASYDHQIISIHNQESQEENIFFRGKGGKIIEFYQNLGIDPYKVQVYNKSSLMTYAPWIKKSNKIQFVHNTFTNQKDIHLTGRLGLKRYWCLCPQANLYIENTLPKLNLFHSINEKITIGTDSLASNHKLSILDELILIKKHYPEVSFLESIKWATFNGAEYLAIDKQFGSLEVGKKPGLVWVSNLDNGELTETSVSKRII